MIFLKNVPKKIPNKDHFGTKKLSKIRAVGKDMKLIVYLCKSTFFRFVMSLGPSPVLLGNVFVFLLCWEWRTSLTFHQWQGRCILERTNGSACWWHMQAPEVWPLTKTKYTYVVSNKIANVACAEPDTSTRGLEDVLMGHFLSLHLHPLDNLNLRIAQQLVELHNHNLVALQRKCL